MQSNIGCSYLVTLDIAPVSSKEFLHIQATIKCGFTLKRVRDMIRTYNPFSLDRKLTDQNKDQMIYML